MRSKIVTIVAVLLLALLLFPQSASAIGVAIGPAEIEIADALRGSEYIRDLSVFNPEDEAARYVIGVEGEGAGWVSLLELDDSTVSIDSISVPGKGKEQFLVKIKVPPDAANGTHTATIYAETVPVGSSENGSISTTLRAPVSLTIKVTGTQVLAGEVGDISASDIEVNYPLRIKAEFTNTGNVLARPRIYVSITQGDVFVDSFAASDTEVAVDGRQIIPLEWKTDGKAVGKYLAAVAVSLEGKVLASQDIPFEILPAGTLTRNGMIDSLTLKGEPRLGGMTKVVAGFSNTGQIDTKAKFVGEVYLDGALVSTLESEEVLTPVGETGALECYLTPETPGEYKITGHINYEGRTTEDKELVFTLSEGGGGAADSGGAGQPTNLFILGGGAVVALVAAISFMKSRRKQSLKAQARALIKAQEQAHR